MTTIRWQIGYYDEHGKFATRGHEVVTVDSDYAMTRGRRIYGRSAVVQCLTCAPPELPPVYADEDTR